AMLDAIDAGADLVIGSRYVPGGSVVNWPWQRHVISRGGNVYSRIMLGVDIKDITAGYRAYRADALREMDLDAIESKGYCFQIDMTWRMLGNGRTVREVPITFTERTVGQSKMSESIFREAAVNVARWGWGGRRRRLRSLIGRWPGAPTRAGTGIRERPGPVGRGVVVSLYVWGAQRAPARRRFLSRSIRSLSNSSRSSSERRSSSMSQWVRGGLTFLVSVAGPSMS